MKFFLSKSKELIVPKALNETIKKLDLHRELIDSFKTVFPLFINVEASAVVPHAHDLSGAVG
jgi:hypothetical protein